MEKNVGKNKMIIRKAKNTIQIKAFGEVRCIKRNDPEGILKHNLTDVVNSFISCNKIVKLEDEIELSSYAGIYSLVTLDNTDELYINLQKDEETIKTVEKIISKYVNDRNSFVFENLNNIKKMELNLTNKTSYEKTEDGIVLNLKCDKENNIHEMEKKFLFKLFNVLFDLENISFVNSQNAGYFKRNDIDVTMNSNLCKLFNDLNKKTDDKVKTLKKEAMFNESQY